MGAPIPQSDPDRFATMSTIDWTNDSQAKQVSILLEADCLCRLLRSHQLHVQDFSCMDARSKECVRHLILGLISSDG